MLQHYIYTLHEILTMKNTYIGIINGEYITFLEISVFYKRWIGFGDSLSASQ